ncbi:MAG TPA: M12 family metallo-peptidase [Flavobacteriales bacterium]|nr:M12 family metallo-peptidase [Flavobacteriales bacterium]
MRSRLLLLPALFLFAHAYSQSSSFWQASQGVLNGRVGRHIVPDKAIGYRLDTAAMRGFLAEAPAGSLQDLGASGAVLELPMPDGRFRSFRFLETPLMHPEMAARYPYIKTYSGVAVDDPRVRLKFDLTPAGFHGMIMGMAQGDAFIDPVALGNSIDHQSYWKGDLSRPADRPHWGCSYDEVNDLEEARALSATWIEQAGEQRAGDCQFRTYRLALACTGEYANFFGATGANKAPAIAAMATTLNRVNGIYERDAALTMVLVANNDQLVFTNPATDGYTNNDGGTMLSENISKCNSVIGSSNYDIGHVFSTGGGGVAYLNSPCTNYKAGGVTGLDQPVGDPFDIDYVAHEMGHQYGGNHAQNNNCNRAAGASVEVGSGITIMGYAGVCSPNVEPHSIAMLGGYSLQEIHANITTGASSSCPQTVGLINSPPTVSAGINRTIPKSTPFVLTAVGSDPDGDILTYSWEQMDAQPSTQPPSATSTNGPNFRPWLPTTDPQRWFPRLNVVASGTNPNPNWEVLSSVGRTYNFRVTARDNAVGGGCNAQSNVVVTVSGTAGPFVVTQPNTAVTWAPGSPQAVTWNVAGTTSSPINCSQVDILLSVDGGLTWPHVLATGVPNNGSATVTAPMVSTSMARVMVRANGNIFYDMGDVNFTIGAGWPYCIPTSAYGTNDGDFINGVMLGAINNTGSGSQGGPSYNNYTAMSTTLQAGGTYSLTVTGGNYSPDHYAAWIDFDGNGTFTAGEKLGEFTSSAAGQAQTISFTVPANAAPGTTVMRVRGVYHLGGEPSPTDPCYNYGYGETEDYGIVITSAPQVRLNVRAWLEGPYVAGAGLMRDDLRAASLLPSTEPYTNLGFAQVAGGGGESAAPSVFTVTGGNAIVDWVRLELRSSASPGTIIATRQALLQRDGDIVDVDGTSSVAFDVAPGNYHVAVRHRNHLGGMTLAAVTLGTSPTTVDLTLPTAATYGMDARKVQGGVALLWMGNARLDDRVSYTGAQNDRDQLLMLIGGANPTATVQGYLQEDCNMDGSVRYTGTGNDRDPILVNTGATPTSFRTQQLP